MCLGHNSVLEIPDANNILLHVPPWIKGLQLGIKLTVIYSQVRMSLASTALVSVKINIVKSHTDYRVHFVYVCFHVSAQQGPE